MRDPRLEVAPLRRFVLARQRLAFAPAKFIGYRDNSVASYRATAKERHGSTARKVVSRILGGDAVKDAGMETLLENYCLQI
ncbi:MAG: hypothetical protein EOP94_02075, partial [Zymomonas sp.]